MTLLSLCVRQGYQVVAAHLNYKLRCHADVEEKLLRDFCQQHDIPLFVCYPKQEEKGNFQKWAREVRYDFYQQIYQQENCTALLLGHQKDDHLENYLMSRERGSKSWYYGIPERTRHHGMLIIRPLLSMRKKDTREYCLVNGVPFGDDESNFSDKYTRNRIRRQLIEKADDAQISQWEEEINRLNEQRKDILEYLQDNYDLQDVSLDQYRKEEAEIRQLLLRKMISEYLSDSPSQDHIVDLDHAIMHTQGNHKISLDKRYRLYLDYGRMYIADSQVSYSYQLEKGQKLKTPYFEISDEGQTIQRIGVLEDEWPLTVRSYQPSDAIELRYGHKKVNRFFIDRKIPQRQRLVWPVVLNRKGEIIFVHGIGCQLHHFCTNESVFMLK